MSYWKAARSLASKDSSEMNSVVIPIFFFSTGSFLGLASATLRVIQGGFLIPSVEKELAYVQVVRFLHVSYNVGSLLNLQFMRFLPRSTFLSMPNTAELQATIKHQMFNIDCKYNTLQLLRIYAKKN